MKYWIIFGVLLASSSYAVEVLKLKAGYVKKLPCEGKLYLSAVGNDNLVRLEALPKELGCAVLLKPLVRSGSTNLVLETSAGSVEKLIQIEGI